MRKKITIYDIAREAGVAPSTVSRVFSGHESVSAKTRAKVEAIARKHQFTTVQNMRQQLTLAQQTIAVIMPETNAQYFVRILSAATHEAKRMGFQTMLFQLPEDTSYDMVEIAQRIIHWRLYGAFYIGGITEGEREDLPAALNLLLRHMPLVALSPPHKDVHCTFLHNDLEASMFNAVQHLYMLGHRRIAFIGGNRTPEASGARGKGYLRAVETLKLEKNPAYQSASGFTAETGEIAVLRMLTTLPKAKWPTAMIAFNDMIAIGALHQLHVMNLKVPEDMALIGCDNAAFSSCTIPPLTTIDLFSEERASTAIAELITHTDTHNAPITHVRAPALIIRESCGVKLGPRNLA
ncbi:MAG: LacI family DNA-binding transcriptional regulator [Firmicutes bacterium]|nr:LacI family DNA-binding transcriptional regulator [Bacillota bacterium]